ncbi:MAG: DUF4159 domain-containing protein [Chitinispirillaceae bacterium]|nr:DUF4159 domain-containing protein [Chitinispirillaceae bacterium]
MGTEQAHCRVVSHLPHQVKRPGCFALLLLLFNMGPGFADEYCFTVARLKYDGGGDWYANPSSLPNLVQAVKKRTTIPVCDSVATVSIDDDRLFHFPFLYMTGHGDVRFSERQRIRLRRYLIGGGFLWADDNYGMDQTFRREIALLFPENPLTVLPSDHPIFCSKYSLAGLPKIHEHDGKPAEGLGVFFENRLLVFYTFSSDIGDGMENLEVHNDGPQLHEFALQMGVNIVCWFFNP